MIEGLFLGARSVETTCESALKNKNSNNIMKSGARNNTRYASMMLKYFFPCSRSSSSSGALVGYYSLFMFLFRSLGSKHGLIFGVQSLAVVI